MHKILILNLLFFGACLKGLTTSAGRNEVVSFHSNTPLRVLLDKGQHPFTIQSLSPALYVKREGDSIWSPFPASVKVQLARDGKGFWVNQTFFPSTAIYLRGGSQHTDPLQYQTATYRGALKVTVAPQKSWVLTNIIPLEDYLYGMLAGEMSPSWEMEALKAQVVAARTYAAYQITHPKNPLYDLEKGTSDQVYLGAGGESDRIRRAVESTRGQMILKQNMPVKSYYHARCGGSTEASMSVWGSQEKEHPSVDCPYCRKHPYQWKTTFTAKEFAKALKLPQDDSQPFRISLARKSLTGRVRELLLESDQKRERITSENLRRLLGYGKIKSARFDLKLEKDEITFEGVGLGHGVGMCQWGAQFLAKQGKNYREILAHYYPSFHLAEKVSAPVSRF